MSDLPIESIEQLLNDDPQTIADQCNIPVVWCDHQVTRRQRLHGANVPGAHNAYTSTHINEVLSHLDNSGFQQAIFICETPRRTHLACYIQFYELEGSESH